MWPETKLLNNGKKWVRKSEQHCNANADQERSINQAGQQEHLGL
jgi:hypothetical protein